MDKHSFAKILLRARYSRLGELVNVWLKGRVGVVWVPLRNLAVMGHQPARDKFARPSILHALRYRLSSRKPLASDNRKKWISGFSALLRRRA